MDRAKLKQELVRDEGIKLESYTDSVGLWTIGVGHLLGTVQRMYVLTPTEVEALLDSDINIALANIRWFVPDFDLLGESRQRALVNMSFNLGSRLGGFVHFLAAVKIRDWQTAAAEMMNSLWAKQVGDRAIRLRDMILSEV